MKKKMLAFMLVIMTALCSCGKEKSGQPQISTAEFLTEVCNSKNYGKDLYSNTPLAKIGENEFLVFARGVFVPYNESSVIAVAAKEIDTPKETAVGGYVGDCSYEHTRICMYNFNSSEITELAKVDSEVFYINLHNDNILEYHIGNAVMLLDISTGKQYTAHEYNEYDKPFDINLTVYNDGEFYFILYSEDWNEFYLCSYDLETDTEQILNTSDDSADSLGFPVIYNDTVCFAKHGEDSVLLFDAHTHGQLAEISSDNELYRIYGQGLFEYFGNAAFNNLEENKVFSIEKGEVQEYTLPENNYSHARFYYTDDGVYMMTTAFDESSEDIDKKWFFIDM
ncbi:MAG: hypothetical protein K2H23_04720 [Oscillospiraceae bacterium]|nr:hypothetical protein [Oscillospiraceae bacterium]